MRDKINTAAAAAEIKERESLAARDDAVSVCVCVPACPCAFILCVCLSVCLSVRLSVCLYTAEMKEGNAGAKVMCVCVCVCCDDKVGMIG